MEANWDEVHETLAKAIAALESSESVKAQEGAARKR